MGRVEDSDAVATYLQWRKVLYEFCTSSVRVLYSYSTRTIRTYDDEEGMRWAIITDRLHLLSTSRLWLDSTHGDASGLWECIECVAVRTLISSGSLRRPGVCGALSVPGVLGDAELAD